MSPFSSISSRLHKSWPGFPHLKLLGGGVQHCHVSRYASRMSRWRPQSHLDPQYHALLRSQLKSNLCSHKKALKWFEMAHLRSTFQELWSSFFSVPPFAAKCDILQPCKVLQLSRMLRHSRPNKLINDQAKMRFSTVLSYSIKFKWFWIASFVFLPLQNIGPSNELESSSVQCSAFSSLRRMAHPEWPSHGSTHMSIHPREREMGFARSQASWRVIEISFDMI